MSRLLVTKLFTITAVVVASVALAGSAHAQGTMVTCQSKGKFNEECKAGRGPIALVRQLSKSPCIEGETWGYNASNRSIWVSQGCRGLFRVGYGEAAPQHYVNGAYPDPRALQRSYYEEAYQRGRQDAAAALAMDHSRHQDAYDRRYEQNFAQGYREGWSDQHAGHEMNPIRQSGIAFPPGLDGNQREYYRDGYMAGKADGQAHMSMVPERHSDHYDSRFESAFRQGYEVGWRQYRMQ